MRTKLRAWVILVATTLLQTATGGEGIQIRRADQVMFANGVMLRCSHDCRVRIDSEDRMWVSLETDRLDATIEVQAQLKTVHLTLSQGTQSVNYRLPSHQDLVLRSPLSGDGIFGTTSKAAEVRSSDASWYGLPDSARAHLEGTAVGHRIQQVGEK